MGHKHADAALLNQAAEWRLIGLLLERPRRGWHADVAAVAKEVGDRKLRGAATAARAATEGDYLHLLGPGGVVSPREVTYQPFADPGQLLAQLASFYDAFAFRPRAEEPDDHIAVEAAFVGYLLLKQAFATAHGAAEAAATTAAARADFVDTHLATFALSFAQRLESATGSYLHHTALCLAARVPARPLMAPAAFPTDTLDPCGGCGVDRTY